MGNGIAHVFAQTGWDVTLVDVSQELLDKAVGTIRRNMDRQIKKGALQEEERDEALARVTTSTDLDAVTDAGLIVEAATESPDVKFKLFAEIDRLAPDGGDGGAILATNTSSISITEIAAKTQRP
jgi:3-hydroxybutyryl-CoA dehydrogenase